MSRSPEYLAYLESDEWGACRAEALARAWRRCEMCTATTGLEVHHLTYERLGRELPDDLMVLCAKCHKLGHRFASIGEFYGAWRQAMRMPPSAESRALASTVALLAADVVPRPPSPAAVDDLVRLLRETDPARIGREVTS